MRLHHYVLTVTLLAAGAASLPAQSTLRPMPSGRATAEVTLAPPRGAEAATQPGTPAAPLTIRLDYGQPHLRGRSLHTDGLVPYDQPWRTGANSATTLTTGVDLVVGGKPVPKGTYVLWTLPTRTGWTLMIQKSEAPGAMQAAMRYDTANDVARVALRQQALATPMESLTMWLIPSATGAAGELRMAWGTTMLTTEWTVR